MVSYNTFVQTKRKLSKLWENVDQNRKDSENLEVINIREIPLTTLKKTSRFALDTTPIYYDLYDFKGITYRAGDSVNAPSPISCYTESPTGTWHFILPIEDYRVPAGDDVEEFSGCPDWEYTSSIGNIRQILSFSQLSEEDIYHFHLLSYLFDDEGNTPDAENFAQFFRWVKNGNGYDYHYHAFWSLGAEKQVNLKAELVLVNKRDYNGIQYRKIQN